MNLHGALISATLLLTMQHPSMPKGMSHEEHMKFAGKSHDAN